VFSGFTELTQKLVSFKGIIHKCFNSLEKLLSMIDNNPTVRDGRMRVKDCLGTGAHLVS